MQIATPLAVSPARTFSTWVSKTPRKRRIWDFKRRFELWLADHGYSLNKFATVAGIPQSSLHAYVKQGARIPVDAMQKISATTGLSIDYWVSDLPYPPPAEVAQQQLHEAMEGLSDDEAEELAGILADPTARARFFRIWRAATGD